VEFSNVEYKELLNVSDADIRSSPDGQCLRTKFCGEYLDVRGRMQQEARENKKIRKYTIVIPFQTFIRMIKSMKIIWTGYCTVLAVLVRITDSATQSFTLFIYFRLHRRYYTTVELEFSNSRTVHSQSLELSYSLTGYSLLLFAF
jgi:hypothetical protein